MIRSLFLSICLLATATNADTLLIKDAVSLALEHNFAIRISKIEVQKSINNARLKTGALLPTLRIDASGTQSSTEYLSSTPPGAAGSSDELRAGIVLNWTLFDGFRMFHAARQIDQQAALARMGTRHQIEAGITRVITTYYNLVAQRALLAAAKEQLTLSREQLTYIRAQYEYGRVGERELLTQEVVFNSDSSAYLSQLLAERSALHAVNLAIGRKPDYHFECKVSPATAPLSDDPEWWFSSAVTHNKNLKLSVIRKNISVTQHALVSSALWPVFAANASFHGITQNSNDLTRAQAGVTLTLPLLSGFSTSTAIKNSALDTVSAALSVKEAQLALEAMIYEQCERLTISTTQVQFEKDAIIRARKALALSQEQFRLGRISDVTFREAQQALLTTQVRYETALYQNRVVQLQLEQLAGKITIP